MTLSKIVIEKVEFVKFLDLYYLLFKSENFKGRQNPKNILSDPNYLTLKLNKFFLNLFSSD